MKRMRVAVAADNASSSCSERTATEQNQRPHHCQIQRPSTNIYPTALPSFPPSLPFHTSFHHSFLRPFRFFLFLCFPSLASSFFPSLPLSFSPLSYLLSFLISVLSCFLCYFFYPSFRPPSHPFFHRPSFHPFFLSSFVPSASFLFPILQLASVLSAKKPVQAEWLIRFILL